MAALTGHRLRCAIVICCSTMVAVATCRTVPSQEIRGTPADNVSSPFESETSAIVPTAQIGSAAEAIPDIPDPPQVLTPQRASGVPPVAEPSVSLKKAVGRFSMLAGQGDGLGMDMLDGEAAFVFREFPELTVTPSAGVIFTDGPRRTDLPSELYSSQIDFKWTGQIATPVFYEVAFMPAVFTDGENLSSNALRLQGRAVGYLAFSEQTQVALGATYLDREDVPILPIVGLLHQPSDDLKLELVFPRPRILGRVAKHGDSETWAYVAGELGGGSWAIERRSGRDDIASYRDYRLLIGLEQKQIEHWNAAVEAGYAFGRELEYDSHRGDYSPDSTFLLRLALAR